MMDEWHNVEVLLGSLQCQTYKDFTLYVCVNQPEEWWTDAEESHQEICRSNQQTIDYLKSVETSFPIVVMDRSSQGNGWQGKQKGVGWARKLLFDHIASSADKNELVVSLDADTTFDEFYLSHVVDSMNASPKASAMAVPYYHPLSGEEVVDRSLLRYECYMRYYLISLFEINNPYAFSALGSAMVFPMWAYKRVGGITPLQGGEDFYLMQKFCKTGRIILRTNALVRPQGRISARVPFGTGPAVGAGLELQKSKYPFFSKEGFDAIKDTYTMFPMLYELDKVTPMTDFLQHQLKEDDIWGSLRKNFRTRELFVKACAERVDGLRMLQFLKQYPSGDECLLSFLEYKGIDVDDFSFEHSQIHRINEIRDGLFEMEQAYRDSVKDCGLG